MATPRPPRQVCVTVVYGSHAGRLGEVFTSFAQNPFLELHAFILGDRLPDPRAPGVTYHLRASDPAWSHPMREADFRRWELLDELEADYALVVDGVDVVNLRPLPELPALLRGAALAGALEHAAARRFENGTFTANFLNAGVTFWDVAQSRAIRAEILARGRTRFRNLIDDQLVLNEVLNRHPDEFIILPWVYNCRAMLRPVPGARLPWKFRAWPALDALDGVRIYHNAHGIAHLRGRRFADLPTLPALAPDAGPLDAAAQFRRRLAQRRYRQTVPVSWLPWQGG